MLPTPAGARTAMTAAMTTMTTTEVAAAATAGGEAAATTAGGAAAAITVGVAAAVMAGVAAGARYRDWNEECFPTPFWVGVLLAAKIEGGRPAGRPPLHIDRPVKSD